MIPDPQDVVLTEIIDAAVRDYYVAEGYESMPAGWVLLINDIGIDTEKEPSGVVIAYPHGSMPWATALGIVEMGRIRMHTAFGTGAN